MKRRVLLPVLIVLAVFAFAAACAVASSPDATSPTQVIASMPVGSSPALVAGNYCASCHLAGDPHLASVTAWKGSIGREVNSPCPAAKSIHEQLYYTERMLLMVDRAKQSVGSLSGKDQARLTSYSALYSRQLDEPVISLDAFTGKAQAARYRLNKIYTALNQADASARQSTVLAYAGIVTLLVLASLAWGLYNTRAISGGQARRPRSIFWRLLVIVAVLGLFALPILRVPAAVVTVTTAEQQAAQAVVDTANRAATASDRTQARAWMLARLAASSESSPSQAHSMLEEALASIEQADENQDALWGQSLAVQEASVGISIEMEKANLAAVDVNAARARDWSLPLIAIEWNSIDPARSAEILQAQQAMLASQAGLYRDLQLRGVALAWAKVDPLEAASSADAIGDAAVRAWTLRELAAITKNPSLLTPAAAAARQVADPVQRARALREVAIASGDEALFEEALSQLDGVQGPALAYALSDLVAASRDASLIEEIDPAYPDARAAALLRLGEYPAAWDASAAIADPYERARAQAAIAGAWGSAEPAAQIQVGLYRDLALRDVIRKTGNASLVDSIRSPYYAVQARTALGQYADAVQAADGLGDSYPLLELTAAMVKTDPNAALSLVDKMTGESDKAAALRVIAAASGDPSVFEKALGMALAARVSGDALAPAEASLELANSMGRSDAASWDAALRQAYEVTRRISTK